MCVRVRIKRVEKLREERRSITELRLCFIIESKENAKEN
jgi:hypothetical protein